MSPCKGCTDRTLTCHGFCKRYQAWKEEHEAEMEWTRQQNSIPTHGWKKSMDKNAKRKARGYDKRKNYD